MRHLILAVVGSSLALAGCGKEEATGNTSALDQAVTAEDFATSDATAIDAATGAAANMAADVEFNALENTEDDDGNRSASRPARTQSRPSAVSNDSASDAAATPEPAAAPADEPAETNATYHSGQAGHLVRLQSQAPLGPLHGKRDRRIHRRLLLGAVHRLDQEMGECPSFQLGRVDARLRPDQLELIALALDDIRPGLRADAQPVDPGRCRQRPVTLCGDAETAGMQGIDQLLVQLKHRLAAGDHHQPPFPLLAP